MKRSLAASGRSDRSLVAGDAACAVEIEIERNSSFPLDPSSPVSGVELVIHGARARLSPPNMTRCATRANFMPRGSEQPTPDGAVALRRRQSWLHVLGRRRRQGGRRDERNLRMAA